MKTMLKRVGYKRGRPPKGELAIYKSPLRNAYYNMMRRCYNTKNPWYKNYGGRGILVCREWREDFFTFEQWALLNGFKSYLTLDRRNNERGYSPKNCRWVTTKVQGFNKRDTRFFEIDGELLNTDQLTERFGISGQYIRNRLNWGWDLQRAISQPVRKRCMAKRTKIKLKKRVV